MKDVERIGTVTMEYDHDGKVEKVFFTPMMAVDLDKSLLSQLKSIPETEREEALQSNADMVMATWFSRSSEIELADRTQWEIKSSILECHKYVSNGMIHRCVIEYTFNKKK